MSICSIPELCNRSNFCLSTCCYTLERSIFICEIEVVGEENIYFRMGRPYLKTKPGSGGACSLLNEETLECTLGTNRPHSCKQYDCRRAVNFQDKYQNTRYFREKRGLNT